MIKKIVFYRLFRTTGSILCYEFYIYSEICMWELTSYISLYNEPPFQRTPLLSLDYVLEMTCVKNAVRMRAFPASGANLPVPPPIEIIRDTKTN